MKIKQSVSGQVVRDSKGYACYVPNPLPPDIAWDDRLAWALSQANFSLGQLAQETGKLANPRILMRPFVTREAVLSSRIEGTQSTIGEILAASAGCSVKQDPDDVAEVQNYIAALELGLERLNTLPWCIRLITEMHARLMQGVRGAHATPGEFRRSQNWIGHPGSTLNTAKFVPPSMDYLMDCLGDWEKFLHNRQLPPLVHIALVHYQFEAIHPFLDGNGRIGRLLITLLLIEHKLLSGPYLYLSAFFEADRNEYYRQLYNVSAEGSWQEWLLYFLGGVASQAEDGLKRAAGLNAWRQKWMLHFQESVLCCQLIERCTSNPYLSATHVAKDLGIAYTTASRAITKLTEAGAIQEMTGHSKGKIFCATEILTLLEAPAF